MALQQPRHSHRSNSNSNSNSKVVAAPAAACSPRLLDFDWSLKYAVASGSIASVEKPLLRLELYVTKPEEPGVLQEDQMRTSVAEFSKEELESVIAAMDAAMEHLGSGRSRR